jgi:hypothetical protein
LPGSGKKGTKLMAYSADFYTFYNQWIAPNTTVNFYYWWNNNKPDEYVDVMIFPISPGSLPVVGRETHNSNPGVAVTITIQNVQNYWMEFDANLIRIPSR